MPTVLSHALVPIAAGGTGRFAWLDRKLVAVACLLGMLPDADVIGMRLGVPYGAPWGHRGATHSIAFALFAVGALCLVWPRIRHVPSAVYLGLAMASHGLLDTLTDGGKGVALFWPITNVRYFAPWRPIRVSPIGARFLSTRGFETLLSEMVWIWLPCLLIVVAARVLDRSHPPEAPR